MAEQSPEKYDDQGVDVVNELEKDSNMMNSRSVYPKDDDNVDVSGLIGDCVSISDSGSNSNDVEVCSDEEEYVQQQQQQQQLTEKQFEDPHQVNTFSATLKHGDGGLKTCAPDRPTQGRPKLGNGDRTAVSSLLRQEVYDSCDKPFMSISELSKTVPKGPSQDLQDLRHWPPDVKLSIGELNSLLTCALCGGYFVNASTVTECMHTFCRSCIVQHVSSSLHCPKCLTLIHPTNPFANLRPDVTMQEILYKLLPQLEAEEKKRKTHFYTCRGLPVPATEVSTASQKRGKEKKKPGRAKKPGVVRHVPVHLINAGSSPGLPKYSSLKKRYLWMPDTTTIGHIRTYVTKKLKPQAGTQVYIFVQAYLVHDALRLHYLQKVFGFHNVKTRMIVIQYAVLPTENYMLHGFSSLLPAPPDKDSVAAKSKSPDSIKCNGLQTEQSVQPSPESVLYSMLTS